MKKLLIPILLFALASCTKTVEVYTYVNTDNAVLVKKDTTITGVWDGHDSVLRITNARIKGNGILKNWIIDAALTQWIFDTTITLQNCQTYGDRFSIAWYGAKSSNADNWWNIQKSINTCLDNNMRWCFVPSIGTLYYSQQLNIQKIANNAYQFCSLRFGGDASYWDNGNGSTLYLTAYNDASALNLQLNKGSEVDHIKFLGQWRSPAGVDSVYFNLTENQYQDASGHNIGQWLFGVTIDVKAPINGTTTSGSTGVHIHDVSISGFTKLLAMSPNGITANDDILRVENLHLGDGKYGIMNGQAQEKDMRFSGVYCWGSLYNLISIGRAGKYQAGEYSFDGANIAGRVIQVFDISAAHWFSTHVTNFYAESIARVGTFSTQMPISISNSSFNLNLNINKNRDVITSNSAYVKFDNTTIRYYDGIGGTIYVKGTATFTNCYYGGSNLIFR